MYRTPLVMPRISRYLSVWLPYTEDFSEWHFKNCVGCVGSFGSLCDPPSTYLDSDLLPLGTPYDPQRRS